MGCSTPLRYDPKGFIEKTKRTLIPLKGHLMEEETQEKLNTFVILV
jgi:hypothetical protein